MTDAYRWDVFISHASVDKAGFVRALYEALTAQRLEVWYDEDALDLGHGLRTSIDAGLRDSRYGVIVLSPRFFGKGWPEWELDGLVQRHLTGTHPVLIPVWHELTARDVAAYSPSLANVVAVSSSLGAETVAERIANRVRKPP